MARLDLDPSGTAGTIELGGRTLLLAKIRKCDFDDVRAWVEGELMKLPRPIDLVKSSLNGLAPELQRHLLDRAFDATRAMLRPDSPEARSALFSSAGLAQMIWVQCRRKHPDVTADEIRRWIEETEIDLEALQARLDEINAMGGDDRPNPSPQPTKPTSPSAGATS